MPQVDFKNTVCTVGSKAATIDYCSSRLVSTISSTSRLVGEILHNIYSGLSLAFKGPH